MSATINRLDFKSRLLDGCRLGGRTYYYNRSVPESPLVIAHLGSILMGRPNAAHTHSPRCDGVSLKRRRCSCNGGRFMPQWLWPCYCSWIAYLAIHCLFLNIGALVRGNRTILQCHLVLSNYGSDTTFWGGDNNCTTGWVYSVSVCKVYDGQMYPSPRIGILGRLTNQAGQDLACGASLRSCLIVFVP